MNSALPARGPTALSGGAVKTGLAGGSSTGERRAIIGLERMKPCGVFAGISFIRPSGISVKDNVFYHKVFFFLTPARNDFIQIEGAQKMECCISHTGYTY